MATYRRKRRRRLRKSIFIKRLVQLACLIAIVLALIHLFSSLGRDSSDDVQTPPIQQPTLQVTPAQQPTPEPVVDPTPVPDPTAEPAPVEPVQPEPQTESIPAEETQAVSPQAVAKYPYGALPASAPVDDSYFDDAVFMGDSVMQGFRYDVEYKRKINGASFGEAKFLTAASYALYHAVSGRENVAHPPYRGKEQPVAISIRDMGAKKVYIMLGMNDIFVMGVIKSLENYATLLEDIRAECPDVEIYILSVIPCTRNAVNKNSKMDKDAIAFFNLRLPDFCAKHNCYYIDVSSGYLDEDGYLKSEYSSDDYVHIQSGCYDFWAEALRTHTAIIQ